MYTPQVLWLGRETCAVTWEPAENVPALVVEEFERGTVAAVTDNVTLFGIGQTTHTLTIAPTQSPICTLGISAGHTVIKGNEG